MHSSTTLSLTHDIWCTSDSYYWLVKCHINLNLNRNTFPFLVAMYIVTYVLCTRTSALSDIALQFGVFGFWLVRVRSSIELDMVKKSIWHRVYNPVKSVAVTHKRHPTTKNKRPSGWLTVRDLCRTLTNLSVSSLSLRRLPMTRLPFWAMACLVLWWFY